MQNELPGTALIYSIACIRLCLPINYTPYVAKQLNRRSYRGRRSYRLAAGSYRTRRRIKTHSAAIFQLARNNERTLNPLATARGWLAGLVTGRKVKSSF